MVSECVLFSYLYIRTYVLRKCFPLYYLFMLVQDICTYVHRNVIIIKRRIYLCTYREAIFVSLLKTNKTTYVPIKR
jgi:hypothetical protein